MLFMGMMSLDGPEDYGRLSDEVLLNKVGTGDQEAFRQLYQNTDRSIYGFILSIVKNPQDAEEIMQETYIKVGLPLRVTSPRGSRWHGCLP